MNISRETVLLILHDAVDEVERVPVTAASILRHVIEEVKRIQEAPGMDSALRRAQEANWDRPDKVFFGRTCVAYRPALGPGVQCGQPATHSERFRSDHLNLDQIVFLCSTCARMHKDWTDDGKCFVSL